MRLAVSLFLAFIFLLSCKHSNNGLFGHSKTKEEAKANGSEVLEYVADKAHFQLLDGTDLHIDTAWTEVNFTYHNGKRVLDARDGYHFSIPFKQADPKKFTFTFSLLDTTNRMFTNGIEANLCQLVPKKLKDEMQILLEQKDPDTSKGWTNPIVTDTITFRKLIRQN
jgi:hypothetical protein